MLKCNCVFFVSLDFKSRITSSTRTFTDSEKGMSFEIFESWLEARIIPGVTTNWEGPDLMPAIVIGGSNRIHIVEGTHIHTSETWRICITGIE